MAEKVIDCSKLFHANVKKSQNFNSTLSTMTLDCIKTSNKLKIS